MQDIQFRQDPETTDIICGAQYITKTDTGGVLTGQMKIVQVVLTAAQKQQIINFVTSVMVPAANAQEGT
jgi:hypothetical protein